LQILLTMPAKKRSKIDRHLGEATRKSIWRHPLLSHSVLSLVKRRRKIYIASNVKSRYRLVTKHDTEVGVGVVGRTKTPVRHRFTRRRRKSASEDYRRPVRLIRYHHWSHDEVKTALVAPTYPRLRVNEKYPGCRRPSLAGISDQTREHRSMKTVMKRLITQTSNYDRLQAANPLRIFSFIKKDPAATKWEREKTHSHPILMWLLCGNWAETLDFAESRRSDQKSKYTVIQNGASTLFPLISPNYGRLWNVFY